MKTTSKISSNENSNADEWLNSFDDPPKKSNDRYVKYFSNFSTVYEATFLKF